MTFKWTHYCFQFALHVGPSSQSTKTMNPHQVQLGRPAPQLSVNKNQQCPLLMCKEKDKLDLVFVVI